MIFLQILPPRQFVLISLFLRALLYTCEFRAVPAKPAPLFRAILPLLLISVKIPPNFEKQARDRARVGIPAQSPQLPQHEMTHGRLYYSNCVIGESSLTVISLIVGDYRRGQIGSVWFFFRRSFSAVPSQAFPNSSR